MNEKKLLPTSIDLQSSLHLASTRCKAQRVLEDVNWPEVVCIWQRNAVFGEYFANSEFQKTIQKVTRDSVITMCPDL